MIPCHDFCVIWGLEIGVGIVATASCYSPFDGGVHMPCSMRDRAALPKEPCKLHARPVSIRCCHASMTCSSESASMKPSANPIAV